MKENHKFNEFQSIFAYFFENTPTLFIKKNIYTNRGKRDYKQQLRVVILYFMYLNSKRKILCMSQPSTVMKLNLCYTKNNFLNT